MAAGRPSKYHDKMPDMIQGYLDNHQEVYGDVVPTVEGLAVLLQVSAKTLYQWYKEKITEEFCNIFEMVMANQGKKLLNGGLLGAYNPAITKMMLTKHGYSDKLDHGSEDGTMTPKPALDVSRLDTETLSKIEAALSHAIDE